MLCLVATANISYYLAFSASLIENLTKFQIVPSFAFVLVPGNLQHDPTDNAIKMIDTE